MTYHANRKARKLWSNQAVAAKARKKLDCNEPLEPHEEIDRRLTITIHRRGTGEHVVFECFEGDRIDNYRVACNDKFVGVWSMTTLTKNIRKSLPRFRRID